MLYLSISLHSFLCKLVSNFYYRLYQSVTRNPNLKNLLIPPNKTPLQTTNPGNYFKKRQKKQQIKNCIIINIYFGAVSMSQGQHKLPFLPDIEPILPKPKSRDGAVIDSLRFSYDLDYDNTLEYSEDGKEINFEFEDYPEYEEFQFGGKHHNRNLLNQDVLKGLDVKKEEDKNDTMDQSGLNRKLEIFQKYRNKHKAKEEQVQTNKGTDIVDSFDRIFNMKGNQPHQSTQFSFKKKIHQSNINSSQPSSTLQQPQNKSAAQTVTENKVVQPSLVTPAHSQPKNSLQFTFSSPVDSVSNQNGNAQTNQINNGNQIKQNSHSNFVLGNEQKSIANDTPINSLNTSFNSNNPTNESKNKIYFDYSQVSDVSNKSFTNQQSSYNELSISNVSNPNQIINNSIVTNFQLKQQIPINNNIIRRPSIDIVQQQIKPNSDPLIPSFVKHQSSQVYEFSPTQPQNKAHSLNDIGVGPALVQGFDSKAVSGVVVNSSNMTCSARLAQPIFDQQNRIAPLFKKIHKMNSIYPNFNHPNLNLDQQSKFCNILAQIFLQAFLILQSLALRALDRLKQPKYYPIQLSSLSYFLNSKWQVQHYKEWQLLNSTIKPQSNFPRNEIKEIKIKDALANYKDVIVYYKERKIYLNNEEGIKSYFRIRQKFWALQRNMRSMSEDIYRIYQENQYPFFYYDYLNMLRAPLPAKNDERTIKYHQNVLKILIINRQRMEPLSCSEVGLAVKAKLERQLKFLCPF